MRLYTPASGLFTLLLPVCLLLLPALVSAGDHGRWSALAAKSKDGVIKLNSETYDEILASDREYSVLVVLTALPAQFKCQPCHEFSPSFHQVAASWRRQPQHARGAHFFAELDFSEGQAIYQRLGLTSAPTVQFHPALAGPNKGNKVEVVNYDLNRNGLGAAQLHEFSQRFLPSFPLHTPFDPVPLIVTSLSLLTATALIYGLWPYIVPLIQSRVVWGTASLILILTFTSGHMWNKIKNAPYVAAGQDGRVSWIAGGYQNQLGLETQVVGGIYGLLAFCVIALTVLVPAQSSPVKQRIGVYLWLGLLVIVFSLLMKLFRLKNGGYPFSLLF